MRPDAQDLYHELWYEGELCCLFADSNLGKSIYAVQMADEIAQFQNVLYVDCELSDKQFQLRYTDPETGNRIKDERTKGRTNWVHSLMKYTEVLPKEWELTQY